MDRDPEPHRARESIPGRDASPAPAPQTRAATAAARPGAALALDPCIREGTGVKLYIAYLRDPDGNKLCALHRVP